MQTTTDRSDRDDPGRRSGSFGIDGAAVLADASATRARSLALVARGRRTALDSLAVRARAARSVSSIRMARIAREIDDIERAAVAGVVEPAPSDWLVLEPPPELDGAEADAFCRYAEGAQHDVLLDMRNVRLLSARGARALYGLVRSAAAAGRTVAACEPPSLIELVMDVTALSAALPVIPHPDRLGDADRG